MVHPKLAIITGMTRDGTFLVEGGKIVGPVRNLRFTQSYLDALAGVSAVSRERKTHQGLPRRRRRARAPHRRLDLHGRHRALDRSSPPLDRATDRRPAARRARVDRRPEQRRIKRLWVRHSIAEDRRDIDGLIATLAPECVYEIVGTGLRWEGHEGARAFYTELFAAFPDNRFALTDIVIGPQGVFEVVDPTSVRSRAAPTGRHVAGSNSRSFPVGSCDPAFHGRADLHRPSGAGRGASGG